jgi:antitoxin YefM
MLPSRMPTISYTEARDRLASVWDETISTREPVTIDRRGHESVVLVPASEWQGLVETAHLLRSPTNARRLLAALNRLDHGEGKELTVDALAAKIHTP